MEALVFPTKYVRGWPTFDDARAVRADVADILLSRYSSDAHFAAYTADVERRHTSALVRDAANADKVPLANVGMTLAVFDVDGIAHVSTKAWWTEEKHKIDRLLIEHPGGFVYATRGGYRIIYALDSAFPLRTWPDEDAWATQYKSWIGYIARRFDIQELETIGDPAALGTWAPGLAGADLVREKNRAAEHPGPVAAVPIEALESAYGVERITQAVRYLERAPLSIKGQAGRNTMFGVCCALIRRMRLPIDVAADLLEAVYNERLREAGTATWSRDEPGTHGMSIEERLIKARDTGTTPAGDVLTECEWNELHSIIPRRAS